MKFVENVYSGRGVNIDIADGMWVLRIEISTRLASHPLDKRRVIVTDQEDARMRPLTQVVTRFARVLCANPRDVQVHRAFYRDHRESHHWSNEEELVLVSAKPFAVVYMADDQEHPSQSGYRRESVRVPRQVHKGELSRFFRPTALRSFASEVKVDGDKPPIRFVRLADVAENIRMEQMEILRLFAQVSPSSYYDSNAAICLGPFVFDDKIIGGERLRAYLNNPPQSGDCHGAELWGGKKVMDWKAFAERKQHSEIFIPERWALDIFTLAHFGFIPGVSESPQGSFDLQTKCPEPYTAPGLLPMRPIDEIRELRGNRPEELSRFRFEERVARVTGQRAWKRTEKLDDRGSFQYYTEYQMIQLFGGRLTIATSFCTTAGGGGKGCWAGFIAVHRMPTSDPRRDDAIYRLMIWPDQIFRQTPEGAVDGFFPELSDIDPEIMATIRKIMETFGFKEKPDMLAA